MGSESLGLESEQHPSASRPVPPFADWILYAGIAVSSLVNALFGAYRMDADPLAYLDISDAIRDHRWNHIVNANWFPFYPLLLTLSRAVFGFRMQNELMAARLLDATLGLVFVFAAVLLAASARRLLLARGISKAELLPSRTLYTCVAIAAYFFVSLDLNNIKPDTLVSTLMVLTMAALLHAIASERISSFVAVGLCGALAFWAKSFAFPFVLLWIFLAVLPNFRNWRFLARLCLSLLVFVLVAAPLLWQISALRGRFTFGEAGRLDLAWYVNHADRFNPVADPNVWHIASANGCLKHPGELLSTSPFISYFGGPHSFGLTPQWTDVSYWSDGLAPRFVPRQSFAEIRSNLSVLGSLIVMRSQALFLLLLLGLWGFRLRRRSFLHPLLPMAFLQALACIGLYAIVLLEGRFVAFALVILFTLVVACATNPSKPFGNRSLHFAVLLASSLLLLFGLQNTLREAKSAQQQGARPAHGVYSLPDSSAGDDLASLYPHGAEVACMGDKACWDDPYWVRYAGLRLTAIIETGNGTAEVSAEHGCFPIDGNPTALDALRRRGIRAIVARFDGTTPCSTAWRTLGKSPYSFYLPL